MSKPKHGHRVVSWSGKGTCGECGRAIVYVNPSRDGRPARWQHAATR